MLIQKLTAANESADRKIKRLNELLTGDYMTEEEMKDYVDEVVFKETQHISKRCTKLTASHSQALNEIFYNHLALPGLINPSTHDE